VLQLIFVRLQQRLQHEACLVGVSIFQLDQKPKLLQRRDHLVLEQVQKQTQLQLHARQHFVPIHVDELELMRLQ
jgi:hypothetical protein